MTCESCEKIIERQAKKADGVKSIKIDFTTGEGIVEFDDARIDFDTILYKIEEKGYVCRILEREEKPPILGWILGVAGFLLIGYFLLTVFPQLNITV